MEQGNGWCVCVDCATSVGILCNLSCNLKNTHFLKILKVVMNAAQLSQTVGLPYNQSVRTANTHPRNIAAVHV